MKIPPARIEVFLKNPDPTVRAVLIYGPDDGLVRERSDALAKAVVPDLRDPFLVADLTADILSNDPARLMDEAAAISMMGGRRVVRVRDGTDSLAGLFRDFLTTPTGDALVVITAGNLSAKSRLRSLFERDKTAGAIIPCYGDEGVSLEKLITSELAKDDIRINPDALSWLVVRLGADRAASRGEVEKLRLYMGTGGTVTLEDVAVCVGDGAAVTMDVAIYAAADGNAAELDRALDRLWAGGMQPVGVLRAVASHLLRLQRVQGARAEGLSTAEAMKTLRPPLFWKMSNRFRGQLDLWSSPLLARALDGILSAEADCKRTGIPPKATCSRALHRVAVLACRGRQK